MKKLQSGFGIVALLFVILVAGAAAAAGVYVYKKQDGAKPPAANNPPPAVQYKNDTDSSKSFSFSYPENWQIEPYAWQDCCEGEAKTEPDWSKESKPITLHPDEDPKVTITIKRDAYGLYWDSYDALQASVKEDFFAKILFEGVREDGHKALFSRVDYLGPPDAKVESFTDHRYYFDNGKTFFRVEFREKYHQDWFPESESDASKYAKDFEQIATSIKFLQ